MILTSFYEMMADMSWIAFKVFLEAKVTFSDCFDFLIRSSLRLKQRICPNLTIGKRPVSEIKAVEVSFLRMNFAVK